jgi:hypothetical protein
MTTARSYYEALLGDLERKRVGLDQAITVIRNFVAQEAAKGASDIGPTGATIDRSIGGMPIPIRRRARTARLYWLVLTRRESLPARW